MEEKPILLLKCSLCILTALYEEDFLSESDIEILVRFSDPYALIMNHDPASELPWAQHTRRIPNWSLLP